VQSIPHAQGESVTCDCGGQMVTDTEVSRDKLRDADWVNKKWHVSKECFCCELPLCSCFRTAPTGMR